jgi:hypothetical protein
VPILATRCPHQHHQTAGQQTVGLEPVLAIFAAEIAKRQRHSREHRLRVRKIEAALGERLLALGRIEDDRH